MEGSRKGFWERLDTPTKVIGAIVATIATAATAYITIAGNPFVNSNGPVVDATPAALAAKQVEKCVANHGMQSPRVTAGTEQHRAYKRCDWPPISDTSTDGFSEVDLTYKTVPNRYDSDLYDVVDIIKAPCDTIDVTYFYALMGGREFVTQKIEPGRLYLVRSINPKPDKYRTVIVQMDSEPTDVTTLVPPPTTGRTFTILHSGSYAPYDAHCALHS
jgi:hypothetical protein